MARPEYIPQNVTDYPNHNTVFSVWQFKEGTNFREAFERVCALVENFNHSMKIRIDDAVTSVVLGISYDGWLKLKMPMPMPLELKPFEPIVGSKHTAVATPGDIHFHMRAKNMGVCFEMAMAFADILNPVAECLEEVHGFRYWDGRSIIGFVDGTENPMHADRDYFGLVGDEDLTYKGGSYLFVQKYLHNMTSWNSTPVEEQEKVIGRYKMSDIEMPDDVKPTNSHSALTSIDDEDGVALKILRDNMPFGNLAKGEIGTYFISYANKFSTTKKMLENMFIGNPVGNYDRLLDFSEAKTGTLYFVPTLDMLGEYSAEE